MSTTITMDWDASYSATSIASTSISDSSSATTSSAIDLDGKSAVIISASVTYGSTAVTGALVYVLREIDGGYESVNDAPWSSELKYGVSSTFTRSIPITADHTNKFKIQVVNNTGASITASISYKFGIITTG